MRGRTKFFSIVVYGRNEAGKSPFMEILTHGNGQSIGKGGQRTTLDVRDYFWNGLKITDVPGIFAFSLDAKEARVDESLALEAAKKADLILFLLTSDAPQPDEAEKLAQLRRLGKPVLGVINDDRAGENWQRRFQSLKFDEKYQELLKSLADECERKPKNFPTN